MATVTGLTAERMQEIIDQQIASGAIDLSGKLIFTRNDGSTFDAGSAKGPKGDPAVYDIPGFPSGSSALYIRLGTMDGVNATGGASMQFFISGIGNYGSANRGTVLVHAGQRGDNGVSVKAWSWGLEGTNGTLRLFTRQLATYQFDIWALLPSYTSELTYMDLSRWKSVLNFDLLSSTAPSGLTEWTIERSDVPIATTTEAAAGAPNRMITPATLSYMTETVKAVLDPTYVGPGPAKVRFLSGGGLSTEAYQWEGKYDPTGNRVVNMKRRGTTWVIESHNSEEGFGGKISLEPLLVNGWQTYNYRNGIPGDRWAMPRAQKLISGIVILSGLIGYGTATHGTVIATLPPGYRPDSNMLFPISNGDTLKSVAIRSTGEIVVEGANWTANTYISLDGIAFPAAGVATWTDIGAAGSGSAYVNGWANFTNSFWGNARYWKDPYGIVWFAGLIYNGSTAADNTGMVTLPATHRAHLETHVRAVAKNAYGCIGAKPTDGLNWKPGTSNAWLSLCGLTLVTTDALSMPWKDFGLVNGWVQNGAQFTTQQTLRREDGLAMSKGLIQGGTAAPIKVGSFRLDQSVAAEVILASVSGAAFARYDIRSSSWTSADERNGLVLQSASTAWASMDGLMWMVGD